MGFNLFGRKKRTASSTDETRKRSAQPAVVEHSIEHSEGELERIGADSAEAEVASGAQPATGQDRQGRSARPAPVVPSATAGGGDEASATASASAAPTGTVGPAASGASGTTASGKEIGPDQLEEFVVDALRSVYDPEIPVNIYDLGLIYDLRIEEGGKVKIKMTLTAPACPVAGEMPGMVEMAARQVEGVTACEVELVWDPAWNPDMMSEAARLQLNI
jgi:FeS assembly SUF system protein